MFWRNIRTNKSKMITGKTDFSDYSQDIARIRKKSRRFDEKLLSAFFSPGFRQDRRSWWKKSFLYKDLFFHMFLCKAYSEKKDFYIEIFFFTKIHAIPKKFFICDTKVGEKKDYYIEIFFFTKFYVRNEKFFGNCMNLGEKKGFYINIFFFTKFYVSKNFSEFLLQKSWWKKRFFIEIFIFTNVYVPNVWKIFGNIKHGEKFFSPIFALKTKIFQKMSLILVKKKRFLHTDLFFGTRTVYPEKIYPGTV